MSATQKPKSSKPKSLAKTRTRTKKNPSKISPVKPKKSSPKKLKTKRKTPVAAKSRPSVFDPAAMERYLTITDSFVVAVNADQKVTLINKAGCKLLGYNENEILGKNWFDHFVPKPVVKRLKTLFTRFCSGEVDPTGYREGQILTRQGEERDVEWETLVLKDDNGKITETLSFGRDITQRIKVEKAVGQSEWDLSMAQKIAGLGSMVYEVNTNKLRWSNEVHKIFGLTAHEFEGTYEAFLKCVHPDDREWVHRANQESLHEKKPYGIDHRIVLPDGRVRFVHVESKVFYDDRGDPFQVRGVIQDITERKETEKALRKSEERLSRVLGATTVGLYEWNIPTGEVHFSPGYFEFLGYLPNEMKSHIDTWMNLIHPEDLPRFKQLLDDHFKDKTPIYECEYRLRSKSGKWLWSHDRGKVIERDEKGNPLIMVGTDSEITDRKIAEEELKKYQEQLIHSEKLSSIGKLSASIAHEVNNPLFGIRNVLERTKLVVDMNPEDMNFIDMALGETDRIADLIKRLNYFYRPTSDKREPLEIHQILDEIILLTQKEFLRRNIQLKTQFHENLPTVTAISDQIKQVMLNLVQNAMDALPETGGQISIKTFNNGSLVKIQIQDNGMGMTPDVINQIFNPFFTTKPEVVGTGLGLSVSYGIVQSHGGTIEVESTPGKGSNFIILLPVRNT